MVITSDPHTVSWWMPPCILSEARQTSLQAVWQDSEGRETFIDEWPIKSSDRSRVTTHIAVVLGRSNQPLPTKILEHASLARSIQLNPNYNSTLTPQHVSSIVADQMPTSPLACGAFNAIILTGPGFAKLSPKRLTCLQRWVRAGGQLLVLPYGEPLRKEHETFLRTVAKGGIEPLAFGRHPITRMLVKTRASAAVFRHGLGRTLILDAAPQLVTEPRRRQWNQILCRWWFAPPERLGIYDGIRRFDTVSGPSLDDLLSQIDQAGPWHRHRPVSLLVFAGLGLGLMFLIGPGGLSNTRTLELPSLDLASLSEYHPQHRLRHPSISGAFLHADACVYPAFHRPGHIWSTG